MNEVCLDMGSGGICGELGSTYIHCLTRTAAIQLGSFSYVREYGSVLSNLSSCYFC